MEKRVIFTIFLLAVFLMGFVYAQNEGITEDSGVSFIDENAELGETEGITPDSALYFIDEFFDRFGDDSSIREEKIAEIRAMIQEGKIEEARIALERYEEHAQNFEEEISPGESEEARRSAAAIYNVLLEVEAEIPEEDREEFFDDVVEREKSIVTAAEIANKIKELCETLSQLDPLEYSRVCSTGEDNPDWHKKLDRKLTEEQRQEAIKFGEIMSQCFETSGQQCRCEEIPFTEFAETCSIAAPLAVQCDIEKNEESCEKLDNLEMPELPPHLQDVFDSLEKDVSDSQFDLHMPRECREAGVTSPEECRKIMIQTNAPEECENALIEADVKNEREAREICEKIMFELNAPQECIEKGLTNPKECGKLMFQINAPQECLDAGLTGESRGDEKKCREIMESTRDEGESFRGPESGFGGANCREIEDSEERLKCYDSASQGAREHYAERQERREQSPNNWPGPCREAGAFTRESCEQVMRQFGEEQRQEEFTEPTTTPSESGGDGGSGGGEAGEKTESSTGTERTTTPESTVAGTGAFLRYIFR